MPTVIYAVHGRPGMHNCMLCSKILLDWMPRPPPSPEAGAAFQLQSSFMYKMHLTDTDEDPEVNR